MKLNLPVSGHELPYRDSAIIISKTDAKGVITEINHDFSEISGFSSEELLGKSHNIVRHPDMPPQAFEHLWKTLKQGKLWNGIVKNRCKNGDHYWVEANVTPITHNGQTTGYISVRTKPSRQQIEQADALYQKLKSGQIKRLAPWSARVRDASLRTKLWTLCAFIGLMPMAGWLLGVPPLVTALASLGLTLTLAPLIIGMIVRPLDELTSAMMATQGDGDLSRRAKVHGDDEVGQAAKSFNALVLTLRGIISEVRSGVIRLAESSSELTSMAEEVKRGIDRQNEAAASSASAIEEMSSSISSVADTTRSVRDDAQLSLQHTSRGQQGIGAVNAAVQQVESIVQGMATSVSEFAESMRKITQMTKQVRDIADQTNLLALNAAIEAARAGEQGRGFAVVADEVRKLAEKSASSAAEIDAITQAIERQSTSVQSSVTNGLEHLASMNGTVQEFSDVVNSSAASVTRAASGITNISSATDEQSLASAILARDVESIAAMAEANVAAISQAYASAQSLHDMGEHLLHTVGRFKI